MTEQEKKDRVIKMICDDWGMELTDIIHERMNIWDYKTLIKPLVVKDSAKKMSYSQLATKYKVTFDCIRYILNGKHKANVSSN